MDTDKIARGSGPEPTAYDRMRHESMSLKPLSRFYGVAKQIYTSKDTIVFPGTCQKCVFDEGAHTCGI